MVPMGHDDRGSVGPYRVNGAVWGERGHIGPYGVDRINGAVWGTDGVAGVGSLHFGEAADVRVEDVHLLHQYGVSGANGTQWDSLGALVSWGSGAIRVIKSHMGSIGPTGPYRVNGVNGTQWDQWCQWCQWDMTIGGQ